jgi:hypothetical protein
MKFVGLNIISIILLISCISTTIVVTLTSNELNVMNQVIKTINPENKIVIINGNLEVTEYEDRYVTKKKIFKWLRQENYLEDNLVKAFIKNNNKQMIFDENIVFDFEFVWKKQYDNNKKSFDYYGEVSFSRIGFNKRHTKALIYVGILHKTEYLHSKGMENYYILEKENNQWKIIKIIGSWIT